MVDLLGEKTALEQTQLIIKEINPGTLSKTQYKLLVQKIYDNQLIKWSTLNRSERRVRVKNLFKGPKQ